MDQLSLPGRARACAECFGPLDFRSWRYPDGKVVCGGCRRDDGYLGPVSGGPADESPADSREIRIEIPPAVEDLREENAELRRQLATLERRLEYLEGWREGAIEMAEAWRGGGDR